MSSREYAMTAWGDGRSCERPSLVRETAERMHQWAAGQPETCQGCQTLPSVGIRSGMPLCGRCREQRQIRTSEPGLQWRAEPEDDPGSPVHLAGLSIVFNSRSEWMGFFEYFRPSAVDRTFAERIDQRYLWSHNPDIPLGRLSAGTFRMRKTARGLSIETDTPKWAAGYVETVKRRDVVGQSFAFETMDDYWFLEEGVPTREVLDARIFESSAVAFPAYPATTLRVVNAGNRGEWFREEQTREQLRWAL